MEAKVCSLATQFQPRDLTMVCWRQLQHREFPHTIPRTLSAVTRCRNTIDCQSRQSAEYITSSTTVVDCCQVCEVSDTPNYYTM
jgi:hypothetical protein